MSEFHYRNGQLFAEDVALADIAAQYGTPAYVYSRKSITDAYREFASADTSHKVTICSPTLIDEHITTRKSQRRNDGNAPRLQAEIRVIVE